MIDAAELAGLSVMQLIHENTAAATMFGIDRTDTEVSIVRYSSISDPVSNKTFEHIEILAEASQLVGGYDLDLVLLNLLAERFNALKERKGKPDVRENARVIKRMLKEVTKVKDILSANKNVQIKLGEL
jgi:molecular chaperone DnaK (HSP70)